jgi:hypothetical protein
MSDKPFPVHQYRLKLHKADPSIKRLHTPINLQTLSLMDTIELLVQEDKKLAKDPELAKFTFKVYELFGNNEDIVF